MARVLRRLRRRWHRAAAVLAAAVALAAAGYGIAVTHTWVSCHNYNTHAYPKAYPECHSAEQSKRPKLMAVTAAVLVGFGAGAIYLWTEDRPSQATRRRATR